MDNEQGVRVSQEFAQRLQLACERCARCPTEMIRGKQKWLYDELMNKFGTRVSPEATRKWFAGETSPRQKTVKQIASILGVDFAWLAVGTEPNMDEKQKRHHNLKVSGAVNLLVGIIQLNGGGAAFSKDNSNEITAIIDATLFTIEVRHPVAVSDTAFRITSSISDTPLVCVMGGESLGALTILHIPRSLVETHGTDRGGYWDIDITKEKKHYSLGGKRLHEVKHINELMHLDDRMGS